MLTAFLVCHPSRVLVRKQQPTAVSLRFMRITYIDDRPFFKYKSVRLTQPLLFSESDKTGLITAIAKSNSGA